MQFSAPLSPQSSFTASPSQGSHGQLSALLGDAVNGERIASRGASRGGLAEDCWRRPPRRRGL